MAISYKKNSHKIKIIFLIIFLFCFFTNNNAKKHGIKNNNINNTAIKPINNEPTAIRIINRPSEELLESPQEKPPITFEKGDLKAQFGGRIKFDNYQYHHMYYFNDKVPDNIGYFKQTIDLYLNLIYGEKRFGHKAFEVFLDLKHKGKWGVVGAYRNTTLTEIKLSDISLGSHDHKSSRTVPWFKEAWMQVSFNAIFNSNNEKNNKTLHFLKAGWFPFSLGRGISLGNMYGTIFENLGLFTYYADTSAPGININGEIIKNKLSYDLYYAKFEDNSASVSDTFQNTINANHIGRSKSPWRGEAKDDELWALRLKWKALNNSNILEFEPYIFFNEASSQKVEVEGDTKTQLGTYGLQTMYNRNNFEISGEVAFNFGKEKLYSIDRNTITFKTIKDDGEIPVSITEMLDDVNKEGAGILYKAYSHVLINSNQGNLNGKYAPVNNASKTAVQNPTYQTRSTGNYYPDVAPNKELLNNKSNRIRPEYKNYFKGWMGIIDAAYQFDNPNIKIAAEYAYASGDSDPHISEVNKNYHNFIALHEWYIGKQVYSMLILGQRISPLLKSLNPGQTEASGYKASTNKGFNDLQYFGLGTTWKPKNFKKHSLKINPNLMFFWKAQSSYKYDFDSSNYDNSQVSTTEKAQNFLGTEINLVLKYELITDLTFGFVLGAFVPGSFYKDVRGVPISGDFYRSLDLEDKNGINPLDTRIGTNNAYLGIITLEYKF